MNRKLIVMAGVLIGLTASYAHADITDGLRNYWSFDDNLVDSAHGMAGSASTVQDDGTFAGLNGTAGIAYGAGKFGQAIVLNGAGAGLQNDGFVDIVNSADTEFGTDDLLTTSMWVRADAFDTGWQTALSHGEGSEYRFAREGETSNLSYAGGNGDIAGLPAVTIGTWHHLLGITDGANGTSVYFDGVLAGTNTDVGDIVDDALLNLNIGANPATGDNNREWNGGIDDVAQWQRALSNAEIQHIYASGVNGRSLSGAIAVPEPTSATLLVFGLVGLGLRRKR